MTEGAIFAIGLLGLFIGLVIASELKMRKSGHDPKYMS
jgi:hypothetical protein